MNCSATTFFRACRARPVSAASRTLVLQPRSTSAALLTPTSQAGTRTRPAYQSSQRGIGQQRAAFSSTCTHGQAQPMNDIPAAASGGIEGRGKDGQGENLAQTVISRAPTDQQQQQSSTTESESTTTTAATADEDAAFLATAPEWTGHVTRVGTMRKTVRVSRTVQVWDKYLHKNWKKTAHDLVHDPLNILNEGDVITYGAFPPSMQAARKQRGQVGGNKQVRFVLRDVVTPFGTPVEARASRTVGSPEGRWHGTPGQVQVQKGGNRARARPRAQNKVASSAPSNKKKTVQAAA